MNVTTLPSTQPVSDEQTAQNLQKKSSKLGDLQSQSVQAEQSKLKYIFSTKSDLTPPTQMLVLSKSKSKLRLSIQDT